VAVLLNLYDLRLDSDTLGE